MTKDVLPYGRQSIDERDVAAVADQMRKDWITQGPRIAEFEEALCELTGARYAVAVSSGTASLHLAALAAGIGRGDVGVTSAITFLASANSMAFAGAEARFADVDPRTGLIDTSHLEKVCDELAARGNPPQMIIPVDLAGNPADLPAIRRIADRHGAVVVEDAAHSLGATYTYEGRKFRCGSCAHAEMSILSFHPVKHITTGEGGAVLTNDPKLYGRLKLLRNHGMRRDRTLRENHGPWYYEQVDLGFNYRITDIQCALGLSQLKRFGKFLRRRRELAARYDQALRDESLAQYYEPIPELPGARSAYHLYVVRLVRRPGETLKGVAARRRSLFEHLVRQGIQPQVHYIPVPRQPWHRQTTGVDPASFPGAEEYYAGCLSVPLFPAMENEHVDRVVTELLTFSDADSGEIG